MFPEYSADNTTNPTPVPVPASETPHPESSPSTGAMFAQKREDGTYTYVLQVKYLGAIVLHTSRDGWTLTPDGASTYTKAEIGYSPTLK